MERTRRCSYLSDRPPMTKLEATSGCRGHAVLARRRIFLRVEAAPGPGSFDGGTVSHGGIQGFCGEPEADVSCAGGCSHRRAGLAAVLLLRAGTWLGRLLVPGQSGSSGCSSGPGSCPGLEASLAGAAAAGDLVAAEPDLPGRGSVVEDDGVHGSRTVSGGRVAAATRHACAAVLDRTGQRLHCPVQHHTHQRSG